MVSKADSLKNFEQKTGMDNQDPNPSELEALKQKLAAAERENETMQREADRYKKTADKLRKEVEGNKEETANKVMNKIVSNVSDELFNKTYKYKADGKEHTLVIKIKPLSVASENEVAERVTQMTGGNVQFYNNYTARIINITAILQVAGVDIPNSLTNPEKNYRVDLLLEILEDYSQWLTKFRDSTIIE